MSLHLGNGRQSLGITEAERRFRRAGEWRCQPPGFAERLNRMHAWLDDNPGAADVGKSRRLACATSSMTRCGLLPRGHLGSRLCRALMHSYGIGTVVLKSDKRWQGTNCERLVLLRHKAWRTPLNVPDGNV
jgi:hypothetical protein